MFLQFGANLQEPMSITALLELVNLKLVALLNVDNMRHFRAFS